MALKRAIRANDIKEIDNVLYTNELNNYQEIIKYAINNGSMKTLIHLITQPQILNQYNNLYGDYQRIILDLILVTNNLPALKNLIEVQGVDPNSILNRAILNFEISMIKYLLTLPSIHVNEDHIKIAIERPDMEIFKTLIDHLREKKYDVYLDYAINQYIRNNRSSTIYDVYSNHIYNHIKKYIDNQSHRKNINTELLKIIKFLLLKNPEISINYYSVWRHVDLLKVLLQHPNFFDANRDKYELKELYDQALKGLPSQIEEAIYNSQSGTLKDLARQKIITHNLDVDFIPKSSRTSPLRINIQTQSASIDWSRVNSGRTTSVNRYYTISELEQFLRRHDIDYPRNSRKIDLINLLNQLR